MDLLLRILLVLGALLALQVWRPLAVLLPLHFSVLGMDHVLTPCLLFQLLAACRRVPQPLPGLRLNALLLAGLHLRALLLTGLSLGALLLARVDRTGAKRKHQNARENHNSNVLCHDVPPG